MTDRFPITEVALFPPRALDQRIARLGVHEFEDVQAAANRQRRMLQRLSCFGFEEQAQKLSSSCRGNDCDPRKCPAACHFASRLHRAEVILAEAGLFSLVDAEFHFFTVVPSLWRVAHDKLDAFSAKSVAGLVERAIRSRGILASFNIEFVLCEEQSETYWAAHVHGLATGPVRETLWQGLQELSVDDLNYRPIVVKTIPARDVPILLNYMTKRVDQTKVRHLRDDGKPRWRNLPMHRQAQATIDAWRCGRSVDALHYRVGFRRNGRFLVRT